jgi:hypothetical protein
MCCLTRVVCSNRMLNNFVSFVFAVLRGSTYRSIRLDALLAAALPDISFEQPAGVPHLCLTCESVKFWRAPDSFQ